MLRSPLTKRNEENCYRVNLDKSKPSFCCVEFNFDETKETRTPTATTVRRGEEAQMLRSPPWSANQISHVLYQYDPMHTCCTEFAGMQSEYDNISDHIRDLIARGRTVAVALREALIFWFAEDLVDRRDRTAITRDLESVVSPAGVLKPFIFVSTKFPPNLSSIEEHGLLFGEQYLSLPEGFFNQSASEQQAAIKSIITKDMLNAESNLGELGPIERYILYPPDGYPFVYAVDGEPDAKANDWTIAWHLAHPVDYKMALKNAKRSPLYSGYMIYKKQDSNDTACR